MSNSGDILRTARKITHPRACFAVQTILVDVEFEKVRDHVPMLDVNNPAASEHVRDKEQRIRLIKVRARGIICTLPYPTSLEAC